MTTKCHHDAGLVVVHVAQSKQYVCGLCQRILHQPLQAACGHRFCSPCVSDALLHRKDDAKCPEDDMKFTKDEMFRDVCAEREILSLEVRCSSVRYNEGCQWTGKHRDLEAHERTCPFVEVPCTNIGCSRRIPRGQSIGHSQYSCEHRIVRCSHCNRRVQFSQIENHELFECEMIRIQCANGCGEWMVRGKFDEHNRVCPLRKISCEFASVGCTHMTTRQKMASHLGANMGEHVAMLHHRHENDQQLIAQQAADITDLKEKYTQQQELMSNLMCVLENLKERMKSMEEQHTNSGFLPGRFGAVANAIEGSQLAQLQLTQEEERKLRMSLERTVALHDVQMSELVLRQDLEQIKTTTGVLLWKIADFSRRLQEAVTGRTPSLYSPPFYTSPCGYKMCARLYPNGDGIGKGTHMSLFFVIMKGEFDALLVWPFSQKISLVLLDQRRINPRHCIETFRPDIASSSFQRPESELNVATGCPLFVSLAALRGSSSYVVDDTLFIKVVVHQQGLVAPDSAF